MGIYRLGHVQVKVPDLELAAAYYTEVVGLRETGRDDNRIYLKAWDEQHHHSVVLQYANRYGVDYVAWKCESFDDLAYFEKKLENYGYHVERLDADMLKACGPGLRFETPSGHQMAIYYGMDRVGNGLSKTNPPPAPADLTGIAPARLDHCLLTAEDVPDMGRFMREVLDFRLTEQVIDSHGHQLSVFLERSRTPHDIAFVPGTNGGLHHFSFWLDNWNDIGRAADILRMNGVEIEIGPTRHGITRGHTIYFFDPVGNRNEVFSGGYFVDPDFEPITWTEEEFGKGLFWYEGKVLPSFVNRHS